jgi:hypothetical protein
MSQLNLFAADSLVIAAGMAWAYVAGRHSIIIARDGWPPGAAADVLMIFPFLGMVAEIAFVWLAYLGRLFTTIVLAVLSLFGALALVVLEISTHSVGYE